MIEAEEIRVDTGVDWYEEANVTEWCATLVIMAYGKCIYWIGKEKVVLARGDFLLIPPGSSYYGKSIPTVFHEKFVIPLRFDGPAAAALPLLAGPLPVYGRPGFYELSLDRIRTMLQEKGDGLPFADVRLQAAVLDTLALWCRELGRSMRPESTRHAERMKAYVQERYRERITKVELGAVIGRSPNHAAALFRRATGMTISGYVHQLRIRTAIYLLRESLLTVAEIAESLGYPDVSYFQRLFKRTTGRPPSDYLAERRKE